MIGTVRLALSYFVLYRAQRWLLALGAGILVIGLASGQPRDGTAIAMLFVQVVAAPLAALTFRELSMRQSVSLAPGFRLRMLASLLIFASLVALAAAVLAPGRMAAAMAFPTRLAVHFALVSLVVLVIAVLPLSLPWWFPCSGAYFGLRRALEANGYRWLMGVAIDPTLPLLVISVLAWAGFASWYLTTPAIGSARRARRLFFAAPRPVNDRKALSADGAATFLLSEGVVTGWRHWLGAGLVVAGGLWLLSFVRPDSIGQLALYVLSAVAGSAGTTAMMEAQRARMLWLTFGSRDEIFRLCERRSLNRCAAFTGVFALLPVYAWMTGRGGLTGAIWLVPFGASLVCAGTYLGMLFVAGRHSSRLVLTGAIFATWFVGIGLAFGILHTAEGGSVVLPALLIAAMAVEGLVCRAIARREWQRIDWLRQRPIRWLRPSSARVQFGSVAW